MMPKLLMLQLKGLKDRKVSYIKVKNFTKLGEIIGKLYHRK